MKLFGRKSKEQEPPAPAMVIAQLNARVQPMDRGDYFEDPLDEVLEKSGNGEVVGGGTRLAGDPDGIAYCDIEIEVKTLSDDILEDIITTLEKLGAPKGSVLKLPEGHEDRAFGVLEGMAIFLNGTDLPPHVYETSDVNEVVTQCDKALEGIGEFRGHWAGERETGLYFYGTSFAAMTEATEDFRASYPLCEKARVVQIA